MSLSVFEAAKPVLTVPCVRAMQDTLTVGTYDSTSGLLAVQIKYPDGSKIVILDAESARRVFNHLGVWLHTVGTGT